MWLQYGYVIESLTKPRITGIKVLNPLDLSVKDINLEDCIKNDIIYFTNVNKIIDNCTDSLILLYKDIAPLYSGAGVDLTYVGELVCGGKSIRRVGASNIITDSKGNIFAEERLNSLSVFLKQSIFIDGNLVSICYNRDKKKFDYMIDELFISDLSHITMYGCSNFITDKDLIKKINKTIVLSSCRDWKKYIHNTYVIKLSSSEQDIEVSHDCRLLVLDTGNGMGNKIKNKNIVVPMGIKAIGYSALLLKKSKLFISSNTDSKVLANLMTRHYEFEDYRQSIL